MRRAIATLVVIALVSFGTFTAFAGPNDAAPPTYPLEQSLMWTQNTQRSVTDQAVGRYSFEAGFYGTARRAIRRYPSHYLSEGIVAAISLSGARKTRAVVPLQFQTSDGDGSPAFVLPKIAGVNLGANGQGIGYELIKERYDQLRATSDPSPLSLIVFEGGTHSDHVDAPYVPRTNWGNPLAADYAAEFLDCYVRGISAACAGAVSARPHLSRPYASEQDPDGAAGPSPSRCITVPDAGTIGQRPQDFLAAETGSPVYDCTP